MLVPDIVRRNAHRHPAKTAVVFDGQRRSWEEIDTRSNQIANHLVDRGLAIGDRVAVCAPNAAEWLELVFAISKAGLVFVPMNVRYAASELKFLRDDADCRAAFVHDSLDEGQRAVLDDIAVVLEFGQPRSPYETQLSEAATTDPHLDVHEERHGLLYTSGTTGLPKGVVVSKAAVLNNAKDAIIASQGRMSDVGLAITPFFTYGGMTRTLAWSYLGQTTVIAPKFDPETTLQLISEHGVTTTTMMPTMLQRVLDTYDPARHDVSSLRRISYGSAPSPPGLAVRAMDVLGCEMQQRYGQTEGGQVTLLSPEDHEAIRRGATHLERSCGRETPQAMIRIVDIDGNDLGPNEPGEVVIVSESQASGYHNRPEESAAKFREDGVWTHDIGFRDEDGYLFVIGRNVDMIISGGFNVYPAEIERVLYEDPAVELVTVIGIPDDRWGESPVAVIVPSNPTAPRDVLEQDLRALCREALAGYKQPKMFHFVDELPLTPQGKIKNLEVRELVLAALQP